MKNFSMTLIHQINEQLASLPKEAQEEVLDFVGYLASKYTADSPTEEEAWDQVSTREEQPVGAAKRRE